MPSSRMLRSAAPWPAIQLKGILSALSSTSSCTVSMAAALRESALARGEHPVDFGRVGFGGQGLAQRLVGHQLGKFGQDVQVLLRGDHIDMDVLGAAMAGLGSCWI